MKNKITALVAGLALAFAVSCRATTPISNPIFSGTMTLPSGNTLTGSAGTDIFSGPVKLNGVLNFSNGSTVTQTTANHIAASGTWVFGTQIQCDEVLAGTQIDLPGGGTITHSSTTSIISNAWDFLGSVQFNNSSTITPSGTNINWSFGSSTSLTIGATALILSPTTGTTNSSIQNTAGGNLTISTSGGSITLSSASKINLAGSGSAGNAAVQVTGSISPSASSFLPNSYSSGNSSAPWAENHAGHYCADVVGGNTVSISASAGSGSGATASISGNDACGNITVNTGTGTTTGFLCQINFGNTYSVAPMVVVVPVNGAAQAGPFPVVDTYTTTTFKLSTAVAWPASSTLIYRYMVMQGP